MPAVGDSYGDSLYPSISADGRYVAFNTSLYNGYRAIVIYDRDNDITELLSVNVDGGQLIWEGLVDIMCPRLVIVVLA